MLNRAFESPDSGFIPIYGRRRVGKSELIVHFLADKPGIYYLGQRSPQALQVRRFLAEAARSLDMPLLAQVRMEDWEGALDAVVEQWSIAHPGRKLVVALDEFQWMAERSTELIATLQRCWDTRWRDSGSILLLICGSYIGFMEREVLGRKSPLFGRRTAQIHLQPFNYLEAGRFLPRWSLLDRTRGYFLVGGLPQYLLCLDDTRSIRDNIRAHLLSEFAPLFQEPTFLLREELREVSPYHAILFAIASGHATAGAIADATGLPERNLHYYLGQLVELGYAQRRRPLEQRRRNARLVRFAIDDPLLRFWFRFVFPNASAIRASGAGRAFAERIAPSLDAWFGACFERLCREALPFLYAREGVAAPFEVGEYWSAHVQIDVVGWRDDNWTDLGECKWGAVRSAPKLEAELERKIGLYPNGRGASIGRRYFARTKPAARANAPGWHSLEDLHALGK